MLLKDIGNVDNLLANSPLSASRLWFRDVHSIQPAEVLAFLQRMRLEGYGREARANIDLLFMEIERMQKKGLLCGIELPAMVIDQAPPVAPAVKEILDLIWQNAIKLDVTSQLRGY